VGTLSLLFVPPTKGGGMEINMSRYERPECPYCGKMQTASGKNVDVPSVQRTSMTCLFCHKPFKVTFGQGEMRISK